MSLNLNKQRNMKVQMKGHIKGVKGASLTLGNGEP
jgi:hypothetical protein